jgi:signal transduction histidine kinase/ligand-binding sensor domain-containing protein/DNA-binding response OmpR family regulator
MFGKIIIAICFFVSSTVFAEDIKLEHYSDENGLSHNSIRHIVQDKTGFLWLGTFRGLNSFDGYRFIPYLSNPQSENSIPNNDITALLIDDADQMWIGSRGGLSIYNLRTHKFKTFLAENGNPQSLPDSEIRALYVDKYKHVWVGTMNQGLCIYDQQSETFSKVEIEGFSYIKSIFEDINGNIWVGSYQTGGIAKISVNKQGTIENIKTYTLSVSSFGKLNPYLYFIFQDDKSDIFVGTREGLYKLDKLNDVFARQPMDDVAIRDILGPYFTCIAQAPNGKYWLGTLGGIVVCDRLEDISKGKFQWYYSNKSEKTSLIDNSVFALYFDHSGVLWIGTENGLDKYDPFKNQFKTINEISLILDNKIPRISGFAQTYDNHLIVATHNNGLFLGNKMSYEILEDKYREISGIYSDDGKTFYCGLWSGNILVYNYITRESKLIDVGFDPVPVIAFNKLTDGKLLIGSHGDGAVILDLATLEVDTKLQELFPKREINQIVSDKNDILWLATETGVISYNPVSEVVKTYKGGDKTEGGLSNSYAKNICIDDKGVIWVATTFGLNYYVPEKKNFVPVYTPKELYGNWITDIIEGTKGELWLNFNNNKVGKFNPGTGDLNIYDVGSGNRLDVFSNKGFLLFNDSIIYLAGKGGIIYFPVQGLKDNLVSDPPFITEVKVQNKAVLPGDTIKGQVVLQEDINYSKKMELDYVNRNFSFSFSTPSYVNARSNKFQYMLEGFEKEWITVDSHSINVQYTNLYPKSYIFRIRASNSSGYWSDESSYQISISPPFWLTYKAIFLILIVLGTTIFLVYKQLKKSLLLKQELQLEKVQREKDEKLNNEKLRFFTNISHELRTPISLILGPAKQLVDEGIGTDHQKSMLGLILQNSNRLLSLVNQLLDFRKAQAGKLILKVAKTDILLYSRNTFNSFEDFAKAKKINFQFICEFDEIVGWIDRDKYDKILYNLLSNAIKFTGKYGNVDLFIGLNRDKNNLRRLTVEVSDDGIGIPLDSQKKIFTRFYQVDAGKEENTGSGIGLSLVKSLVQLHKAAIKVQSTPDKGSVFFVEIPIDRESYDDSEVFDYELKSNANTDFEVTKTKKAANSTELKERILLIEDNNELRKYIAEYLSDFYRVFEAENGEEGLQVCGQIKPILCVADVMMPVMDGFEFCAKLKSDERISHIPVILLTALSENENRIKGYKLGADAYLIKPFDPALLKIRIDNIIKTRLELKEKFSGDIESDIQILTHSPIDEEFMVTIKTVIEENISDPKLAGNFLCTELGISSSTLYRRVKELTDLSPNEFIRTIRLKKAVEYLKSKRNNVSEVSTLVGFNDPYYFSRCFKKQFGFPPSSLL